MIGNLMLGDGVLKGQHDGRSGKGCYGVKIYCKLDSQFWNELMAKVLAFCSFCSKMSLYGKFDRKALDLMLWNMI